MGLPAHSDALEGPEVSHNEHHLRHVQVVFARKMQQRQLFMEDLRELRNQKQTRIMKLIRKSIGPNWYQILSVHQRSALDKLETSIYQDLLEGVPVRTQKVMRILGLYPRPKRTDLMHCAYVGRYDPKQMLAHLYWITFAENFDDMRQSYSLNAKLMLSAMFYLGVNDLIAQLKDKFKPEPLETPPNPKRKRKREPPLKSPYLEKMVAALYIPQRPKRTNPAPLPNLDALNEPWEEKPVLPPKKELPPQPPPPPPKKTLPIPFCEKLAGIMRIEPKAPENTLEPITRHTINIPHRKAKASRLFITSSETKRTSYGMGSTNNRKRKKKPVAPNTGTSNAQYLINGVYSINGKSVFVLGNVSVIPPEGELIHGGHRAVGGEYIKIHCGIRNYPPPRPPEPCDCMKRWHEDVISYLKSTKCYCGHNYDFRNEGTYSQDELQYFQKPTRSIPYSFNYATIFELDSKCLHVEKEFKRVWETDSVLGGPVVDPKLKKVKKRKQSASTTCLGQTPRPEDYLKCALRYMGKTNIAARLPDAHLTPELKEWMRRRLYGPFTRHQRREFINKSGVYWTTLKSLESKGFGHVSPANDPRFMGRTTWAYKQELHDKFKQFYHQYKIAMYRSQMNLNNLLWATMFSTQFPDKSFRQTYFSYLVERIENMQFFHPYSSREAGERSVLFSTHRYCCLPDGIEPEQ